MHVDEMMTVEKDAKKQLQREIFGMETILKASDPIYAMSPCIVVHFSNQQILNSLLKQQSSLGTPMLSEVIHFNQMCTVLRDSRDETAYKAFYAMQSAPLFKVFSAAVLNSLVRCGEDQILFHGDRTDQFMQGVAILVAGKAIPIDKKTGEHLPAYRSGAAVGVLRLPAQEWIDEVWNADNPTDQQEIADRIAKKSVVDDVDFMEKEILEMPKFEVPKGDVARVVYINQRDFCNVVLHHQKSLASFGKPGEVQIFGGYEGAKEPMSAQEAALQGKGGSTFFLFRPATNDFLFLHN